MLPDVDRLAQLMPDLRLIINHEANVRIDGKQPPDGWIAGMKAAAKGNKVFCKVSALAEGAGNAEGKAPKETAFYQPVLDVLWNAFGEDRLIFGSNWPVSERYAAYGTIMGIVTGYFEGKGRGAVAKYFGRNSLKAYKWHKR
jgi:L-fuconolactonase